MHNKDAHLTDPDEAEIEFRFYAAETPRQVKTRRRSMRLPLELDAGPPPRRSFAGKPPRKKGGPGDGPTKTSNELNPRLRRIEQQGKQICFRLPTDARRAFYSVLVQELARAFNLITAGIPLNSRLIVFKSIRRILDCAKRRAVRRRVSRRTANTVQKIQGGIDE
jgi:hypothetical protein